MAHPSDQTERIRSARIRFEHVTDYRDRVSVTEFEIATRPPEEKDAGFANCVGFTLLLLSILLLWLLNLPIVVALIPALLSYFSVKFLTYRYNQRILSGARDFLIDMRGRELELYCRRRRKRVRIPFRGVSGIISEHQHNGRWELLHVLGSDDARIKYLPQPQIQNRVWSDNPERPVDGRYIAAIIGVPIWEDFSSD